MKTITVVIESPNKRNLVSQYVKKTLSSSNVYTFATVGHFRDLPKKEMGIDFKTFKPKYVLDKTKKKNIDKIIEYSKKSSEIYIATDPDREGEAIGWHVETVLKMNKISTDKIYRLTFNEITAKAVAEAIKNKGKIDYSLVKAQETRRVLDRFVGFLSSQRLMQEFRQTNLSAGRVQIPALKLVYDRCKEIENFKPEPYFEIVLFFDKDGKKFTAKRKFEINDFDIPEKIFQKYNSSNKIKILKIEHKTQYRKPPAPYNTQTLQADISKIFKIPLTKAMNTLQNIFAKGLITYHRTDSTRVSDIGINLAKKYISELGMGDKFKPNKGKAGTQDGHECIRPTGHGKEEELNDFEKKVYDIIKKRFIASQMKPAIVEVVTVKFEDNFISKGEIIKDAGYMAFYRNIKEKDEDEEKSEKLPNLKEGEILDIKDIKKERKFTTPPSYYTQATFLNAIKKSGIGRPSTYASIVDKLFQRKYIEEFTPEKKKGKFIKITEKGINVVNFFERNKEIEWLLDVNFTADMEEFLDKIANKKVKEDDRLKYLRDILEKVKKGVKMGERQATIKMVDYAKKIASQLNISLPDNIENYDVCKKFIDDNIDKINKDRKPSDKMVETAKKFMQYENEMSDEEKKEILSDYKKCSDYISRKIKEIKSKRKGKGRKIKIKGKKKKYKNN